MLAFLKVHFIMSFNRHSSEPYLMTSREFIFYYYYLAYDEGREVKWSLHSACEVLSACFCSCLPLAPG